MTKPVVRFAPSPTGRLHIGNARTALYNWIFTKRTGGQFILRFDDTDATRSTKEFADGIVTDLAWLGIEPDRIEQQSARFEIYAKVTQALKSKGLLYPCYETADELERGRSRRRARGLPPIYDRSALKLTYEERAAYEAEDRKPHWRFLLPNFIDDPFAIKRTEIKFDDLFCGCQTVDLGSMSDPVLVRADGSWLYTLPSIIDDAEFGVTHVIRGADHVANTGVQIAIFKALDYAPPSFGHHNLLTGKEGEGLSKRYGSLSLQGLREEGFEAMSVASLASLIGTSNPVEPKTDMMALAEKFDPRNVSKSPARFDIGELNNLNAKFLHYQPFSYVQHKFDWSGLVEPESFWLAVRGNVTKLNELVSWKEIVTGDVTPLVAFEDQEMLMIASQVLPDEPWSDDTWVAWTNAVKAQTGRKGRALFMPLRKAVTGRDSGPDMSALLPLIGHTQTLARLVGSSDHRGPLDH